MVSGSASSRARATARRRVAALSPMSTMRASPFSLRWVRPAAITRGPSRPRAGAGWRAVTSSCRIRLSPTRKVPMPALSSRWMSAWVLMPLSETRWVPVGDADREIDRGLERRLEGAEVAVVDADELGVERQRAVELDLVVHLDQRVHPPFLRRHRAGSGRCRRSTAARMMRMQSAPRRAALGDLVGLEQEVLAQHRQRASRRAPRSGSSASPGSSGGR